MTRDQIIKLAREIWGYENWSEIQLSRFKRLVTAAQLHEREACAQIVERNNNPETRLAAAAIRARNN